MTILYRSHGSNPEVESLGVGNLKLKLIEVIVKKDSRTSAFSLLSIIMIMGKQLDRGSFSKIADLYPPAGREDVEEVL